MYRFAAKYSEQKVTGINGRLPTSKADFSF